jgi:ribosomal protein L24
MGTTGIDNFKIGDRVIIPNGYYRVDLAGEKGTVVEVEVDDEYLTIEFDKRRGGHQGRNGLNKDGHCWHVHPEDVELLEADRVERILKKYE